MGATDSQEEVSGHSGMPKHIQKAIEYWIYSLGVFFLAAVIFLERFGDRHKSAWIAIITTAYVGYCYLMVIYLTYAREPKYQKRLKAIVDSSANFLAICTLIVAYISMKYFGTAGNLFEIIAQSGAGSVLSGVIFGVLLSRVLFPFWDLYSVYRKL
ncbi:hypothetical protein [Pantoea dispersa]|uniref:hypothetical protein n=1 Tax=Pantoea dispersa TaxID=59814 RepID=UPI00123A5837|nr:hypothetical protein [Pantoea dispersa]KAA8672637.1 hypothetical protein F4W08_06780 [Pantoea dispersa]